MAGHVAPEARHGGPIAAVRDGDTVIFDVDRPRAERGPAAEEIAARVAAYESPPPLYEKGVLGKYARHVGSAAQGAITS